MLRCDIDLCTFDGQNSSLSEEQCKVSDSLLQVEETLPHNVKSTLVYTVGYITK